MRKALLVLAFCGFAASLWAADPIIGTWKLNVAKSKFAPGQSIPKEQTDVCRELNANLIECASTGINADGSAIALTVSWPRQGGIVKIQPPTPDMFSYVETLVKPGEWYVTFMMNGVQIQLMHKVVSKDGKTGRVTTTGVGLDGKPYETVAVSDRQ
jgi:hypothetical protein